MIADPTALSTTSPPGSSGGVRIPFSSLENPFRIAALLAASTNP